MENGSDSTCTTIDTRLDMLQSALHHAQTRARAQQLLLYRHESHVYEAVVKALYRLDAAKQHKEQAVQGAPWPTTSVHGHGWLNDLGCLDSPHDALARTLNKTRKDRGPRLVEQEVRDGLVEAANLEVLDAQRVVDTVADLLLPLLVSLHETAMSSTCSTRVMEMSVGVSDSLLSGTCEGDVGTTRLSPSQVGETTQLSSSGAQDASRVNEHKVRELIHKLDCVRGGFTQRETDPLKAQARSQGNVSVCG
jgi:hypothetical protein